MSEKERDHTERARTVAGPGDGSAGLPHPQAGAESLLRAADDVIARALSADSERFLQATRQSGGQ